MRALSAEGIAETEPLLLTVPEAAKRLSLGRATVYGLIYEGSLESVKIGKSRRVPVDAIDQFIAALRRH